ncbi:MAG: class I SAM-dependent methyltransferase [Cyanobacteria bacterium P01_H01_bin.119]
MTFQDHFSNHSPAYSQYRPRYPDALFIYLASLCGDQQQAWDCATGNGQAALSLTQCFRRVVATDASEAQIQQAAPHPRVTYRVSPAANSGLGDRSCDLITVAQALHWFDRTKFYLEANRVLKANGILAVWCYQLIRTSPELDALVYHYYDAVLGEYWPPERRLIEAYYQTIDFPFEEIETPNFTMTTQWSLDHLLGYLNTWSATQRYIAQQGQNPLESMHTAFAEAWGKPDTRSICWPLHLRVGKVHH